MLLSKNFTPFSPKITEHGPSFAQSRLPFLGKTFTGCDECKEYFQLLGKTLQMELGEDAFPALDGYIVDVDATVESDERTRDG